MSLAPATASKRLAPSGMVSSTGTWGRSHDPRRASHTRRTARPLDLCRLRVRAVDTRAAQMIAPRKKPGPAVASEGEAGALEPGTPAPATSRPDAAPTEHRIRRLMRLDRRQRLSAALAGAPEDRWRYALGRQLAAIQCELLATGLALYDRRQAAGRIVRNYHRLEKLAEARGGKA